jgi:membrane protein implicated in regulation of membrane protease activity
MIEIYQITLILAIISIILEMITGTLLLYSVAFSFLIVAIFQFISDGFEVDRDLIIFSICMLVSIIFLRKTYKKKTDVKCLKDDDVNLY